MRRKRPPAPKRGDVVEWGHRHGTIVRKLWMLLQVEQLDGTRFWCLSDEVEVARRG